MDYLEGMLLHSWWSDTDYESRKHTGTWLWFSFLSFLFLVGSVFVLNYYGSFDLIENRGLWRGLTIVLFLVTPFLCMIYYRLPFFLKVPILILLALKYMSAFIWAIDYVAQYFVLPEWLTIPAILNWGDETFGRYLENTTAEMGVSGLFYGGAVFVLVGVIIALVVLALAIVVPIFLLKLFNLLQFFWDKLFIWLFYKVQDLYYHYQSDPSEGKFAKKPVNPQTRSILNSNVSKKPSSSPVTRDTQASKTNYKQASDQSGKSRKSPRSVGNR